MEDEILIFFQSLVDKIKLQELTESQKKLCSEFYLSYNFLEKNNNESEKELLKYASLGWFIYNYNKKN